MEMKRGYWKVDLQIAGYRHEMIAKIKITGSEIPYFECFSKHIELIIPESRSDYLLFLEDFGNQYLDFYPGRCQKGISLSKRGGYFVRKSKIYWIEGVFDTLQKKSQWVWSLETLAI